MKNLAITLILLGFGSVWASQITRNQYIDQWKDVAQGNMQEYKIPASIILAQGILESSFGNSDLAQKANNHFGIKCHNTWTGDRFFKDDDAKNECFRSYKHALESYRDHAIFLTSGRRYAELFTLDISDYKAWAHGLKKAGYATHPQYAEKLIRVIEENELYRFDLGSPTAGNIRPQNPQAPAPTTIEIANVRTSVVNRVQCVIVEDGQTLYRVSKATGVSLRQLYKYNDFAENQEVISKGDIIYLQPKRNKSSDKKIYVVNNGNTTLRQISQIEGVKLKSLMRKNSIENPDAPLKVNSKIKLK
jgi:LysM repeat protein